MPLTHIDNVMTQSSVKRCHRGVGGNHASFLFSVVAWWWMMECLRASGELFGVQIDEGIMFGKYNSCVNGVIKEIH